MSFKLLYHNYLILKSLIWFFYFTYVVVVFNILHKYDLKIGVLLCGVIIQLTLIPFLNNWYKNKRPSLVDWFCFTTFISMVYNFMTQVIEFDVSNNLSVFEGVYISSKTSLIALILIIIGLISFRFGAFLMRLNKGIKYFKKPYIILKRQKLFFSIVVSISFLQIIFLLAGFVGFGTTNTLSEGSFSFIFQTVNVLSKTILVALGIFKFVIKDKNKIFSFLFIGFFSIQILTGFLSGMKENIIVPILLVLIVFIYGGNKIALWKIIVVGLFISVLYPINNNYRDVLYENSNLSKDVALKLAVTKTFQINFSENVTNGAELLANRFSSFNVFMYGIENESKWDSHKYLDRYIYLPVAWLLPRFILPNKPKSDTGGILFEIISGEVSTVSVTPSTYGWAYLEGGVLPLIISFFIYGIVISFIETKISINSFLGLLIFSSLFTMMLKAESDIYFRISGAFQSIFINYLFYVFFFRKFNLTIKSNE
jgi:hypothetical protein